MPVPYSKFQEISSMGDDENEDEEICVDADAMMDLWKGEAA